MTDSDLESVLTCAQGHESDPAYFLQSLAEQQEGKRLVFLAVMQEDKISGFVHYNRAPAYQPFRSLNVPEIQDLYVAPFFRRAGIARALIGACEARARVEGLQEIGIGVGIGAEFGPAQNLYGRLGYVPDGAGVVFDRDPVRCGEVKPVDNRLCLMMIKNLD